MKSVTAAEAAALGAWRVVSAGDRVGALVFNDVEMEDIKPQRSKKTVMQILQMVLRYNHALKLDAAICPNPAMLNQALSKTLSLVTHDYLITIVSDFDGANAETKQLMTQLSRHNDVLVILVYDKLGSRLPEAGKLGDERWRVTTRSGYRQRSSATTVQQTFRSTLESGKRDSSKTRVSPVLPVHTAEGVAEQVRQLLGYSPRTRRGK